MDINDFMKGLKGGAKTQKDASTEVPFPHEYPMDVEAIKKSWSVVVGAHKQISSINEANGESSKASGERLQELFQVLMRTIVGEIEVEPVNADIFFRAFTQVTATLLYSCSVQEVRLYVEHMNEVHKDLNMFILNGILIGNIMPSKTPKSKPSKP